MDFGLEKCKIINIEGENIINGDTEFPTVQT